MPFWSSPVPISSTSLAVGLLSVRRNTNKSFREIVDEAEDDPAQVERLVPLVPPPHRQGLQLILKVVRMAKVRDSGAVIASRVQIFLMLHIWLQGNARGEEGDQGVYRACCLLARQCRYADNNNTGSCLVHSSSRAPCALRRVSALPWKLHFPLVPDVNPLSLRQTAAAHRQLKRSAELVASISVSFRAHHPRVTHFVNRRCSVPMTG